MKIERKGVLPGLIAWEPLSYRFRKRSTMLIVDQIPARMVTEMVMISDIIIHLLLYFVAGSLPATFIIIP